MYEDELADNGISIYSVKLRVMDFGWFVLARHYLRVEKVCIKAREVRFYHQFGQASIIKELKLRETRDSCHSKKTIDECDCRAPNHCLSDILYRLDVRRIKSQRCM